MDWEKLIDVKSREKNLKRHKQKPYNMWGGVKYLKIHLAEVLERGENKNEVESTYI